MPKAAFYTLGCKLNFSETSVMGEEFLKKGFQIVDFTQKADVYVVNTCTVTENADRECRQIVRRAVRNNPGAFVIVTGCYAQLRSEEIAKIDGVDAVLGSNEKFRIFDILKDFEKKNLSCIHVSPKDELNEFHSAYSTEADSRTRAFLKIQDGCDYKCSFCTIPIARGLSRSAEPSGIINKFRELLNDGYKEIVLTGVNVGDFQFRDTDFYGLLRELTGIDGDYRIRISSIEPNLLSDEILDLVADSPKLCDHFHIPLQSGSPKILKLMRRRYTADEYYRLIDKARSKIKDLGIGVDVIVGFPGETEEDFIQTYDFLRDLPVSYLHVFTYSERDGTQALRFPDNVDPEDRKRRNRMLRILSAKKKNRFYRDMIGKDLSVLFEEENDNGFIKGFASNYTRIKLKYDANLVNKFSPVEISHIDDEICSGKILTNNVFNSLAG